MMQQIFFSGWEPVVRTLIGTTATYLILVLLLRVTGPRTLAKWYAFDLIVTVALGSVFANGVVSKDTTIAQATAAFLILIALQFSIAWLVSHWQRLRPVVNPRPMLLLLRGEFQRDAMRRQRVAEADVRAALRGHGHAGLDGAMAVVLEPDGTFSVIEHNGNGSVTALTDVEEFKDGATPLSP
jgi:uncharacterized membrane protein YcaP (DUF421 family)